MRNLSQEEEINYLQKKMSKIVQSFFIPKTFPSQGLKSNAEYLSLIFKSFKRQKNQELSKDNQDGLVQKRNCCDIRSHNLDIGRLQVLLRMSRCPDCPCRGIYRPIRFGVGTPNQRRCTN